MENIIYNKYLEKIENITNLIRKAKGNKKRDLLNKRADLQSDLTNYLKNPRDSKFIQYFSNLLESKYSNIDKIESQKYKKDLIKIQKKIKQKMKGGASSRSEATALRGNIETYKKLKVAELKQKLKEKNIKGYSKLNKSQLIELLNKNEKVKDEIKPKVEDEIKPKVEEVEEYIPELWERRILNSSDSSRLLKINSLKPEALFLFVSRYPKVYSDAFILSSDDNKNITKLNSISEKVKKSKSLFNQLVNGIKLVAIVENKYEAQKIKDNINNYENIKQLVDKHKDNFEKKQLKKLGYVKIEPENKEPKKRGRKKQELRKGLKITFDDFKNYAESNNYTKAKKYVLVDIAKLAGITSPQKLTAEQIREIITDIIVNKKGAGIFDDFKGLINKGISKVKSFFDPYKELRPIAQKIIKEQGNKKVVKIYAFRKPVMEVLNKVLNLVSLGKFEEGKKLSNYDTMYHLGLIFQLNDNTFIMTEKNERIDMEIIKAGDVRKYGELFPITVNKDITFGQVMGNAKNGMGDKFLPYDPFMGNNCQVYAMSILKYSDLLTPQAEAFIFQPLDTMLKTIPKSTPKVARAITQLGAFFANIGSKITGRGLEGGKRETYAEARAREARQQEEFKKKNEEAKSKAYERTAKQAKSAKLYRLIKEMKDKKQVVENRLSNLTPEKRDAIIKIYEDDIKKVQDYDFYNISNENLKNQLMNQLYTMVENMNHSPNTYGELPKRIYDDINNPVNIKYVYDNYGKVEPSFWGDIFPSIVSGLVSFVPVVGTLASTAMDVGLDILKNSQTEEKGKDIQDINYDVLQQDTVNKLQDFDNALQQAQAEQENINNQLLTYEQERQQIENALSGTGKKEDGYELHAVIVKGLPVEEATKIARDIIKNKNRKFSRTTKSGSIRYRNIAKTKFQKKSFRTKIINPNVSLIYGKLK
jgi:hypothetical protein